MIMIIQHYLRGCAEACRYACRKPYSAERGYNFKQRIGEIHAGVGAHKNTARKCEGYHCNKQGKCVHNLLVGDCVFENISSRTAAHTAAQKQEYNNNGYRFDTARR